MKFDWRKVSRVAATMVSVIVPQAVAVEQAVEGVVDSKGGEAKALAVVNAALGSLEAEGELAGKQYATPRVKNAVRGVNDAAVELLNALAEAHATSPNPAAKA